MGLFTWNKPSAACLASRIPYGEIITHEKIKMIDTAEEYLAIYGYHQCRVRMHGNIARIELMPEDIPGFVNEDVRTNVYEKFREIVDLHPIPRIMDSIKVEIVPATFSNDANLIGAFMTYVKLKGRI